MLTFLGLVAALTFIISVLHWYSYRYQKRAIIARRRWCLNICCGTTDGGGINVDIVQHAEIANYLQVADIYNLPFHDQCFDTVLCSHTAEHIDYPDRFDRELRRVGREVVYIVPPIWDLAAACNIWEHKWLFLTARKVHRQLPRRIRLPFSRRLQARIGQRVTS